VAIPRVSINTRPSAWGPDGEVFRPSRWLDADGPTLPQVSVDGWNNFDAFGEGSRFCIGYRLAIFEMKAIMAALVRAFKFEEVQGIKIKKRNLLTLQPLV
ncbi:cytochrome P450, partial [Cantharellus anzutake]|uniref:cytochrome P450 n=1 Tax=Cantharellus anzutake TaxID=1750568 RepID=UPI00190775AA